MYRDERTYGERSVAGFQRPVEWQPLGSRLASTICRLVEVAEIVDEKHHLAEECVWNQRVIVPD